MDLVIKLLAVFLSITGIHGYYYFDFFNIMNIAKPNRPDVSVTKEGPTVRGIKRRAFLFGNKTDLIKYEGDYFAFLANTITNSSDFTFYTYLKITQKPTKDKKTWTFFTLRPPSLSQDVYFSIGIVYKGTGDDIEGRETNLDNIEQRLIINQATTKDRSTHPTYVTLKNKITFNTWHLLMVRIRDKRYTVTIDCEVIGDDLLSQGKTEKFPYGGVLTFSQSMQEDFMTSEIIPVDRFVGGLHEPVIINGESAFAFYSPCDADFTIQEIPTEPLPGEYNPARFDKFVEMTTENVLNIRISCKGSDNKTHYSGTTWKFGACTKESCNNGVLEQQYSPCKYCVEGDKSYKDGEKWFNPDVPCEEKTCLGRTLRPRVIKDTKTCPPLNCDKFGSVNNTKARKVCCDECWRDTCKDGKEYYEGCDRLCSDGADFTCKQKKPGCWCKPGYAQNDKGECIPSYECVCKSGSKTYLPGQAAVKSPCETCVCSQGSMICFASCII